MKVFENNVEEYAGLFACRKLAKAKENLSYVQIDWVT